MKSPPGAGVYEVPASAVVESDGVTELWRVSPESSEVSLIPVEMLGMANEFIRVSGEDLKPGDIIVRAGTRFLSESRCARCRKTQVEVCRHPQTSPRSGQRLAPCRPVPHML